MTSRTGPRALVAVAAVAALAAGCGSSAQKAPRTADLRVGDASVRVEIAASKAARTRGLSGRRSLGPDQGMLFVHHGRGRRTYWMKGMRFPIDIVWIDRGRVTGVERSVPVPRGNLPLYSSPGFADRVLEVPAGWAARHGVERGDVVRGGG